MRTALGRTTWKALGEAFVAKHPEQFREKERKRIREVDLTNLNDCKRNIEKGFSEKKDRSIRKL